MTEPRERLNAVAPSLRSFAQGQRSTMPRGEELFWQQVRAGRMNGHKFKRQVPITPFIVDFLCASARLVVEIDGPVHERADVRARDAAREEWLRRQGFAVLRFSDEAVLGNCQVVLDAVLATIEERLGPSPASLREAPSPAEGRGL